MTGAGKSLYPLVASLLLLLAPPFLSFERVASAAAAGKTPTQIEDNAKQAAESAAHPVAQIAASWLKIPSLQQSQVGLEIMDLPTGQVLFSSNGSKRFTPASTAKVFTTACSLDALGPDFRYRTQIQGVGTIKKDKLAGDLTIVAAQDPTFDSKDLYQLLGNLSERKIKYIEGRVALSAVPGGSNQFNTGWLAEDWGQTWMPVSSNLVLDRNVAPGKDPGRGMPSTDLSAQPSPPALFHSLLRSDLAAGWVVFEPASKSVKVYHSANATGSTAGDVIVANPDSYNLAVATAILHNLGIRVNAHPISVRAGEEPQILGEHLSKPITEIIRECLKESDNLYAQQLLRTLGCKYRSPKASEFSTLEDNGLTHIKNWLSELGVHQGEVVLVDGCGLSRKNLVSPHALNMVLKHMAGKDLNGPYLALLRQEGSGRGSFRFKTGAMDSVRAVSGVIRSAGGNTLAVTVMVNGHLPQVGAVRSSIYSLTSQLEAMPALPAAGAPSVAPEPKRAVAAPHPISRARHSRPRRR
jgi:D-alanyl-D-alanine carboxypeptidase/D-alanyl-D-alanine-endopeptidase (penicillin-binding protein 4)